MLTSPDLHDQENSSSRGNSRSCTPVNVKPLNEGVALKEDMDVSETPDSNVEEVYSGLAERRERIGLMAHNLEAESSSEEEEETEDQQLQREIEESEALARQLMAEEAMASYQMAGNYLRDNAEAFSGEDLAALQAAMQEEDPEADGDVEDSEEMDYDQLLELGERIGDVKTERWKMRCHKVISKLETQIFKSENIKPDADDSELKCLVCQCQYEEGEELRKLPCGHVFHKECGDEWLGRSDLCPYCRTSVEKEG